MSLKNIINHDLNYLAQSFLLGLGLKVDKKKDSFIQLLKLKHWLISDQPRLVSFSKSFSIPRGYDEGFKKLVGICESGIGGLFRYQSRGLYKGDFNDFMYLDFGIHHLHLGLNYEKNGMI